MAAMHATDSHGASDTCSLNCVSHLRPTIVATTPPTMSDGTEIISMSLMNSITISFTRAPLTLRMAISLRRRLTSSAVYPMSPMKAMTMVTMPAIITESRKLRWVSYIPASSVLRL